MDGHDKLKEFGFEIYGAIDGFSRMMLNCDVGISNGTEVAIMSFFLRCVTKYGFPKTIRSDKGSETDLMAECQL